MAWVLCWLVQMISIFDQTSNGLTFEMFLPILAQNESGGSSNAIVIAAVIFLLVLMIAGFFLWRTMFATNTDFSQRYQDGGGGDSDSSGSGSGNELNPKAVSKSAETVSNEKDDDVVDELRERFSSRQTVDSMGDQSVIADEDEDH